MIVNPGRWRALIEIEDDGRAAGARAQAFVDRLAALSAATGGRMPLLVHGRNPRAELWREVGLLSDTYYLTGVIDLELRAPLWSRDLATAVARSWRESGAGGHIDIAAYATELDADEHDNKTKRLRWRPWVEASANAALERNAPASATLMGDGWHRPVAAPPGPPASSAPPGTGPRPDVPPAPGRVGPVAMAAIGAVAALGLGVAAAHSRGRLGRWLRGG